LSKQLIELPVVTIKATEVTQAQDPAVYLKYLFEPTVSKGVIENFVKSIESVYRGSGIPSLFGALSTLADKSVLFIGTRGTGKTRVINCIPDYEEETITQKVDTFTYNELDTLVQKYSTDEFGIGVKNLHFVFKIEEFSALSEYHRGLFLTVCSKICSDHNYSHVSQMSPHLLIENCKLTMFLGVQPILYSKLCNFYPQWESMSYDRFTKFLLLNPLREDNTEDIDLVTTFPTKIPTKAEIPSTVNLEPLVSLFRGQVSTGRATLYAKDYAKAIARFQGKSEVSQEDVDLFVKLFSPYLEAFSRLQERRGLDLPITVSSGAMELVGEVGKHMNGITKQELARNLWVTDRTIERGLVVPIAKGLIIETEGKYYISEEIQEYFKWYSATFSSQMSSNTEIETKEEPKVFELKAVEGLF
jgi:hypothetical protein